MPRFYPVPGIPRDNRPWGEAGLEDSGNN